MIPSANIDEEKKKQAIMFLDPDLQRQEHCCRRLKEGIKVFCKFYVRDWVTCPLILLYFGSLIFAIISAMISYNTS